MDEKLNNTNTSLTEIIVFVLCHSGNIKEASNFCRKSSTLHENESPICLYLRHELKQSKYFENEFFFWWHENKDKILFKVRSVKWIGCITPHYSTKTKSTLNFIKISQNMEGNKSFFAPLIENMESIRCHPRGIHYFNETMKQLGIIKDKKISMFKASFCNYWLMDLEALNNYSEVIVEIKNLWESNNFIYRNHIHGDPKYFNAKMDKDKLMDKIGFSHYTYHPFLMERMNKLILISMGYKCSNEREYNPDMDVISATYGENDVTILFKELINFSVTFTVRGIFSSLDKSVNNNILIVTFRVMNKEITITIGKDEKMVPMFI